MTSREKASIDRFETFYKCSKILKQFFEMGFRSYSAFQAIVMYQYPDVDLIKLKRFWNCIGIDEDIATKVDCVFNKLKNE
jgi:hypothetical protein